jgi:hypothetical protein
MEIRFGAREKERWIIASLNTGTFTNSKIGNWDYLEKIFS